MIFESLDKNAQEGIDLYIKHVRSLNFLTDEQLRETLAEESIKNPEILEKFKLGTQKKLLNKIKKEIDKSVIDKSITNKSIQDLERDATKIARKVA